MPEYLAPGVFVEEVSFRAKSIEGVATSTTGFAGMTRFGPVRYPDGPEPVEPRLVTSFAEYERAFGGLEPLGTSGDPDRVNYMAHAVRAFFLNGGARLYVARVFAPVPAPDDPPPDGVARAAVAVAAPAPQGAWAARWPGSFGNVLVRVAAVRSRNIAFTPAGGTLQARGARNGALVEVLDAAADQALRDGDPLDPAKLRVVLVDAAGTHAFHGGAAPDPAAHLRLVELTVTVTVSPDRVDVYDGLGAHPQHKRAVTRILAKDDPADEDSVVWLDWASSGADDETVAGDAIALAVALTGADPARLAGGADGQVITDVDLTGEPVDPDDPKPTGLNALAEVDDIAIVAAPDASDLGDPATSLAGAQALVAHAEACRYRIAILDGPKESTLTEIREFRGQFDSTRAALYHPWVIVLDPLQPPTQGAPPPQIPLPPSGFVAGIYARSDTERGVWKAPANEIVRGITRFEANINTGRQQVLNPEGINALRFFEGRGNRVWGARTATSDPEWKYVNVRRLFIYLEHSIDKSTQWAVFEPNGERLWANVRQTIEDFLLDAWKDGALLGAKPEEAYFVRCDRTTMTQNDLDNGRLICLVGVAPVRPAEFVIFRIGQFTADSTLV
jgi:phage tail sheath protein FI